MSVQLLIQRIRLEIRLTQGYKTRWASFKVYVLVSRLIYGFKPLKLLIAVILLDAVSTNNCVFHNLNPQRLEIISTSMQMSFMTALLFVHLCNSPFQPNSGGLYLSGTPFFAKRNQDCAELASRIGYSPLPIVDIRYVLTTVSPTFY